MAGGSRLARRLFDLQRSDQRECQQTPRPRIVLCRPGGPLAFRAPRLATLTSGIGQEFAGRRMLHCKMAYS